MSLLTVEALQTFYGKSHVLRDVSFTVPAGGITVLLGRNGAGKTTTLRSIMGLTPPRAGAVRFKGRDITGHAPHRVFHLGVGYVPEGRQIFPHLDVGENLRLAERAAGDGMRWTLDRIFEYFPVLRERLRQPGRSLSGGEQQMLAIARALAGNPELLMLDEPSQGLAPRLVRELESIMLRLKGEGVTLLLVEQNARMASPSATRCSSSAKAPRSSPAPPPSSTTASRSSRARTCRCSWRRRSVGASRSIAIGRQ